MRNYSFFYDGTPSAPWYKDRKKIKTVIIKDGVTSIGENAFYGCSNFTSITIPNSVKRIGKCAFTDCTGLTSITIPNSVTSIEIFTFMDCQNLTSITIGNSVTSIGESAFYGCSGLTSVTIPNSVTSIGENAFYECSNLTSVTIPNSVTSIGKLAFYNCKSLTSITIPNSVTSIGDCTFMNCQRLTSITIPNSVTSIGSSAFSGCTSLPLVTIPNSVTSIGSSAFSGCTSLLYVTIPNSVTSIGSGAFFCCSSLDYVGIPNSVTSIGNNTFYDCTDLYNITIPSSVSSIGESAFSGCSGLTSITIPNSVTSIENNAFSGCSGLTSITFEGTKLPEFGEYNLNNVNKSIPVYVPANSREEYKNALKDFGLSNIKAIPITLKASESYTQGSQIEDVDVSYARNFSTNWEALYLPFSLKYEDWKDDFEIAYISAVRQEDIDDDGKIDNTILEFVKLNSGSTAPNTPYIIRAKKKGEKTLSVENTTLYKAEDNSIDCSTTTAAFTFTGTYKGVVALPFVTTKKYYVINGEKFSNSEYVLPYHWYLTISSRNDDYAEYSNPAKEITISVLDDEEVTGIRLMQMTNDELPVYNSSVYDMNGRKINENSLKPGMYIKNGRKFVVK